MTTDPHPQSPALGGIRRKAVRASSSELVQGSPHLTDRSFLWRFEPAMPNVDLVAWAADNLPLINERLQSHGGVLFRGFGVDGQEHFQRVVNVTGGSSLMEYKYASTPRSALGSGIYTSTEYPADQSIPMHNEMSYARSWPKKIWFYCEVPAQQGGATPLADSRAVFQRISPAVKERFRTRGVQYIRNYGGGLDLSWQRVFGTSDKAEVEAFCTQTGMEWEWLGEECLRTRQRCQGVLTHPQTGAEVWFNQAHIFHVSALPAAVRDVLLASYTAEELPRHAAFGDGSPIPDADLDEIRSIYETEAIPLEWERGDVVLLDNLLAAHGRQPFVGPRKVLVAMAEPGGEGAVPAS